MIHEIAAGIYILNKYYNPWGVWGLERNTWIFWVAVHLDTFHPVKTMVADLGVLFGSGSDLRLKTKLHYHKKIYLK